MKRHIKIAILSLLLLALLPDYYQDSTVMILVT